MHLRIRRPKIFSLLAIVVISGAIVPNLSAHLHSGEVLVSAEWREAHPGPNVISLTVAMDEEWLQTFGPDAERQARRVVELSAVHLRPAGIDLRVDGIDAWTSDDEGVTLHDLLDVLERGSRTVPADMVLGLTAGQYGSNVDGVARLRRPYVVVKHHPGRLERDAYVLTHEIGHVLGLDHHDCPDGRCLMADHKYDLREHWCPEHLELLQANGGFFQYAADNSPEM
ncbi:MAG: M12 family metallo-peptidase [Dehalococcoidia bacterium]